MANLIIGFVCLLYWVDLVFLFPVLFINLLMIRLIEIIILIHFMIITFSAICQTKTITFLMKIQNFFHHSSLDGEHQLKKNFYFYFFFKSKNENIYGYYHTIFNILTFRTLGCKRNSSINRHIMSWQR